jgi:hypothetical protein
MRIFALSLFFLSAFTGSITSSYAADAPPPGTPMAATPLPNTGSDTNTTIHQFDRYLLVFHFEESTEFDEVGNLVKQEYKFGNQSVDINPMYLTNQHNNSGTVRGKGGVNQVIILETPVNENSEASIHFIEATSGGLNTVTIYEIAEKKNVFRCFYTRIINSTDHKDKKSKQLIIVNKGLGYPVNKEGEHITQ